MKVFILGLGSTIQQYKPNAKHITFGVNDIFKFTPVKHLVCVNAVGDFEKVRQNTISKSTPDYFHSIKFHTNEWLRFFPVIDYMNPVRKNDNSTIDTKKDDVLCSSSSNFMAAHLAYKIYPEMKSMNFYGVDFTDHRNISGARLSKELLLWKWLFTQLQYKGIKIVLPIESKLNDVL